MRKVKLTKNVIKKNAVLLGLTKKQIIGMAVTVVVAVAAFSPALIFGLDANLFGCFAFFILMLGVCIFIVKINGRAAFRMLIDAFFVIEDVRYFSRGGMKRVQSIQGKKKKGK